VRRSTATVFAIFFALTFPVAAAFAVTVGNHDTKPHLRMGKNSCRASAFHGVRRNSIKLYREVQRKSGTRAPGRNIVCNGVRTKHGLRKASFREVRAWRDVLQRMAHPYSPAPTSGGALGSGTAPNATLQSIAQCESGGNPSAVSPGGQYRGKYQFSYATWQAMGGSGDPAAAPESVQDAMAAKLYAASGPGQWPVCGR
jgi:hypothetical protein